MADEPSVPWYQGVWNGVVQDLSGTRPVVHPQTAPVRGRGPASPAVDQSGRRTQPTPETPWSLSTAWQNFHPMKLAMSVVNGLYHAPEIPEAVRAVSSGAMLNQQAEQQKDWERANPNQPDSKNPFIQRYTAMRAADIRSKIAGGGMYGPQYIVALKDSDLLPKGFDARTEMLRDRYIANQIANQYSYKDSGGNTRFDWNAVKTAVMENPNDVAATVIPMLGVAGKMGKLALMARLGEGSDAAAALEAAARVGRTAQKIAMGAVDPVNNVIVPRGVGAAVKIAKRGFGGGASIYDPNYLAEMQAFKKQGVDELVSGGMPQRDAIAKVNAPENQDAIFQHFNETNGGKWANPFNNKTSTAISQAGLRPEDLALPSRSSGLQSRIGQLGGVPTPAAVKDYTVRAFGGKPTRSMATDSAPSPLWDEAGARQSSSSAIQKALDEKFGSGTTSADVSSHVADAVSGNMTGSDRFSQVGPITYKYDPETSSFVPVSGASNFHKPVPVNSPVGDALYDNSYVVGNGGLDLTNSPNPVIRTAAKNFARGMTDPRELSRSIEDLVDPSIFSSNGGIRPGSTSSLPGDMNYRSLHDLLPTEGQGALADYARGRVSSAPNPAAGMDAGKALAQHGVFTDPEVSDLVTGLSARSTAESPIPKSSPSRIVSKLLPNVSTAGALGYILGHGDPAAAGIGVLTDLGAQGIGSLGLRDRFGAPSTLDSSSWYSGIPGAPTAPQLAPTIARTAYDVNQMQAPNVAAPTPAAVPYPVTQSGTPAVSPVDPRKARTPEEIENDNIINSVTGPHNQTTGDARTSDEKDYDAIIDQVLPQMGGGQPQPENQGGRVAYKKGGKVSPHIEPLVQDLMSRYKHAKTAETATTKPLLQHHDKAIVTALSIAKKAI